GGISPPAPGEVRTFPPHRAAKPPPPRPRRSAPAAGILPRSAGEPPHEEARGCCRVRARWTPPKAPRQALVLRTRFFPGGTDMLFLRWMERDFLFSFRLVDSLQTCSIQSFPSPMQQNPAI